MIITYQYTICHLGHNPLKLSKDEKKYKSFITQCIHKSEFASVEKPAKFKIKYIFININIHIDINMFLG